MKYFVTGGTGFIGSRLIERLLKQGHRIHALVRDPARAKTLIKTGAALFTGDITDRASVKRAMEGTDGVFHLAAIYKLGIRDKKAAVRVNVDGSRNVLETMMDLGIKKGVYTSSLAVFSDTHGRTFDESYRFEGRHITVYDETKWRAHYEIAVPMMEKGLPLVIVLPGAVYGPGDSSSIGNGFVDYLNGSLKMVPVGTVLCWSYIDDVVQGHLLAMEKGMPQTSYIIAGPPAPIEDAFLLLERFSGVKAPGRRTSPRMLRILSFFMKLLELFVKPSAAYSSEGLRVMAGATYLGDNRKAVNDLGYSPRSLEEGLRETVAHLVKTLGIIPAGTVQ